MKPEPLLEPPWLWLRLGKRVDALAAQCHQGPYVVLSTSHRGAGRPSSEAGAWSPFLVLLTMQEIPGLYLRWDLHGQQVSVTFPQMPPGKHHGSHVGAAGLTLCAPSPDLLEQHPEASPARPPRIPGTAKSQWWGQQAGLPQNPQPGEATSSHLAAPHLPGTWLCVATAQPGLGPGMEPISLTPAARGCGQPSSTLASISSTVTEQGPGGESVTRCGHRTLMFARHRSRGLWKGPSVVLDMISI